MPRTPGRGEWALLVTLLAVVGLLTWWLLRPSAADAEQARWRTCVESAADMAFDPPGGAEAWCVTTTRSRP